MATHTVPARASSGQTHIPRASIAPPAAHPINMRPAERWVSIPGVYGGIIDKVPMGAAFQKGLSFKMGQTHVHKYLRPLLTRIENGEIESSFVIAHRLPLDEAPHAYDIFKHKQDKCIKVVLKPREQQSKSKEWVAPYNACHPSLRQTFRETEVPSHKTLHRFKR